MSEIVLDLPCKVGGCAIGDLDTTRQGNEIVALSTTGEIYLVYREGDEWKNEVIFKTPGEMIQCAVGDADPEHAGHELAAVGIASGDEDSGAEGVAYIIRRRKDGWKGERIFRDDALIHGVCIGREGVLVAGYSLKAHLLVKSGKEWRAHKVADLPGPGKNAVRTEEGFFIACKDGSLLRVSGTKSGWKSSVVDQRGSGRSRLGTDGSNIIVSDDDGTLSIIGASGREKIYSESSKLRGAVLADLDPSRPGLEAATAGYLRKVTVLYKRDGRWMPRSLFGDTDRFHHLAAGDLDGYPGKDLAACSYSGRVVVIRCRR
jgi:hypothetical protein